MPPALTTAFHSDPAALALALPFESGELPVPAQGELCFLRARPGPVLALVAAGRWRCQQGFKPLADRLLAQGLPVERDLFVDDRCPLVLCLPPRQREESRAVLAHALAGVEPGGRVVVAMANAEGARSGEADLSALAGPVSSVSKHKCRVFWARRDEARLDGALLAGWLALEAPRPILDGRYLSRPGLFAWDRIDPGSALLAAQLPQDLAGEVADLGAGWGYLAIEIAGRCRGVTALHLYEAQARALEPARANLERHVHCPFELHWHDVTMGLPRRYDAIVSNPPFHQGRADEPELGRAFVRSAARALRRHGQFWLVANRHLPYEATLSECFAKVRTVAAGQGYKVLQAQAPRL